MNAIVFSLWGDDPMYTTGAVRNVELYRELLPDWRCVFYHDDTVSEDVVKKLRSMGAITKLWADEYAFPLPDWLRLFWRILAIDDGYERMIVRDTDSRPTSTEGAAVRIWMNSRKLFHVIKDHPNHFHPIMGGLWGCIPDAYGWVVGEAWDYIKRPTGEFVTRPDKKWFNADQAFLAERVWPRVKDEAEVYDGRRSHDEGFAGFMGNKYTADDVPVYKVE